VPAQKYKNFDYAEKGCRSSDRWDAGLVHRSKQFSTGLIALQRSR
jgi:hypothetical protein